ncbi:cob(I)yrinic acid a,c-diamide adenosyltransferase [Paradesulfitobacterium aromaticivorans]
MITVYTGSGKGKTTSALGESLSALSHGQKVVIVQFLKGSTYSGELTGLYRLGIHLVQFGVGCVWSGMIRTGLKHCTGCGECFRHNRDPNIAKPLIEQAISYLKDCLQVNSFDLFILDEISHALNHEFMSLSELRELLTTGKADWILTGRKMPESLRPLVDCWWELNMEKHPFQQGKKSRRGIEY